LIYASSEWCGGSNGFETHPAGNAHHFVHDVYRTYMPILSARSLASISFQKWTVFQERVDALLPNRSNGELPLW
jgi:hypothetical protein